MAGATARTAASLVGVNTTTAAFYFQRLRQLIHQATEEQTPCAGELEVDESCFGGRRKGKRGRGAAGKLPVFGLLKRGGKVAAKVIADTRGKTLKAIMERQIVPDSIGYTDTDSSYNVLAVAAFRHYRSNHSLAFAQRGNHINGSENFWNQAQRPRRKFNGLPKPHFPLDLAECQWRFNQPSPKIQWRQLKQGAKPLLNPVI